MKTTGSATSCLIRQENDPFVIYRKSYSNICDGHKGAALLLSFFEGWHNHKLATQSLNKEHNDVAERHGSIREYDESLYQWHTMKQLHEGIQKLVGEKSTKDGIKILREKGFISVHKNPNPRFKFDSTNHYLLHPKTVNKALSINKDKTSANCEMPDTQIAPLRPANYTTPTCKSHRTSTKDTTTDTNKDTNERETRAREGFSDSEDLSEDCPTWDQFTEKAVEVNPDWKEIPEAENAFHQIKNIGIFREHWQEALEKTKTADYLRHVDPIDYMLESPRNFKAILEGRRGVVGPNGINPKKRYTGGSPDEEF